MMLMGINLTVQSNLSCTIEAEIGRVLFTSGTDFDIVKRERYLLPSSPALPPAPSLQISMIILYALLPTSAFSSSFSPDPFSSHLIIDSFVSEASSLSFFVVVVVVAQHPHLQEL